MKIEQFDPALRKSLLDDINDLENNNARALPRTERLENPTRILSGVSEIIDAEEEEIDLEDFR